MKITDFLVMDGNGSEIEAAPYGNNLAFCCFRCEHPILAVALEHERGSDEGHPAGCRRCGAQYFLDIRPHAEKIYIHVVDRIP